MQLTRTGIRVIQYSGLREDRNQRKSNFYLLPFTFGFAFIKILTMAQMALGKANNVTNVVIRRQQQVLLPNIILAP